MTAPLPAPPAAPESLRVATGDGHDAPLQIVSAPDPGPALLWLPAMGVPARKYRHFAAALGERGCTVALHEWRGQDGSNRRAARDCDWGYAELLRDIAASRAALETAFPGRRWTIGGHSLGGQLAALALARDPSDYAGYALVGSGHPWWRTFPGWHKAVLLSAIGWFRAVSAVCGYFPGERAGFAGREARGVMRDWAASAVDGSYRPARIDFDAEARLREVALPGLAVRLTGDRYVPRASLDHLVNKLPLLHWQRADIGGAEFSGGRAGHFEWLREPAPVVRRVAEWIDGIR
ncbi:MAG TPA: alpha/beta fold hydrolase [Tahibacter sp.]|uniref:alpha/beta hydrolase family protein n=1 Tax=Tahibacter sp. TaxID=2056211 RepID=UPI002BB2E9BF|nr:alpha/beta fold hydrolase [Tahibacter sp.]HSX62050.1 alpha/beta fold hydrolase [Tahibacter sp.]